MNMVATKETYKLIQNIVINFITTNLENSCIRILLFIKFYTTL
jgi:hypothetical protein